jgi:hypothetical protein
LDFNTLEEEKADDLMGAYTVPGDIGATAA